jgi:isopentenyl diphosphate isomerase/L-lactate dehydrogenase-like FMN-dependent dehydrogenase
LGTELRMTMQLCGATSVAGLDRSLIRHRQQPLLPARAPTSRRG